MEILRFEEAPTSAPQRKKSSRGFIALGFVATLFGVSTAFASSTITINNPDNTIALGQGVSVFTTCDTEIGVEPVTTLDAENVSKFGLTKVVIGSTTGRDAIYEIDNTTEGCLGTDFVVKFYDSTIENDEETPENEKTTPVNVCTGKGFVSVSGTTYGTNSKCVGSAIYFRVSQTSHDIQFSGLASPDFFDRISIETTTVSDYSLL
jgi:hypothetical protein